MEGRDTKMKRGRIQKMMDAAVADVPRMPKPKKLRIKPRKERETAIDKLKAYPVVNQNPDKPLNERQKAFVKYYVHHNLPKSTAARQAGFKDFNTMGRALMKNPAVIKAIELERSKFEAAGQMTRKRVLDGFLEAIDMGRLKADSIAMTAGWREIAKLCGYYEPTKHKVEISVNGQVTMAKLQQMTDAELLALAEKAAEQEPEALPGTFREIHDGDE